MKEQLIYKSEEGKKKISNYYNNILSQVDFEYKENYIKTSYGETYVLEAGKGENPPIFLFHGSCSNSAMWYGDIKVLEKHFHVFSVDILGEPGKSEAIRLNIKSDDHAHWINELLKNMNIPKAIFMGNSLGAWMAQKFAVNYPEKADKLVLIAPSGVVPAKLSFVFKSIFYAMQGEKGLAKLGELITELDKLPDEVLLFNKLISDNFNPIIGGLPVFSDGELKRLTMPTLFMCGENDVTLNAQKAAQRFKNSLPNVQISLLKDNGHVIYDTAEKIIPFLNKGVT